MERIALLVDQIGKGENIFENFAIEFENARLKGEINIDINVLQEKIEEIERRLQDISEKINAHNENKNIYSIIIKETRKVLSIWLPVFSRRNIAPKILNYFDEELNKLLEYLIINKLEQKNTETILSDFETKFTIGTSQINSFEKEMDNLNLSQLSVEWVEKIAESVVNYVTIVYDGNAKKTFRLIGFPDSKKKAMKLITRQIKEVQNIDFSSEQIEDGEDTLYSLEMKLWIDTDDASEANRFANEVTQILSKIENVKVLLVDCGKGSYWQTLKIRAQGWFAKEETKQVLAKTQKALEAYALDKHIEPIEKSKIERQKQEEEIKRLMSEEQTKELHQIEIAKGKEELEALKLTNLEKKLVIMDKMSSMLANGLVAIDSNYRIEINGALLIQQTNKVIETNDMDILGLDFNKVLLPPSTTGKKDE